MIRQCLIRLTWCVLLCAGLKTWAGPISLDNPLSFFTNVSARLLQSQLNLDVNHILVYPTDQYTPAAHRLLQVAANLYDATTNRAVSAYPFCPSVFRPVFRRDTTGNVFIAGYLDVEDDSMVQAGTAPAMVDLASGGLALIPPTGTPIGTISTEPMVRGFPLVIGAKKGFPNFNEFAMQTYLHVTRLLEFRRDNINGPLTRTNQLYVATITNTFGLEAWNSYQNPYPRNLQLIAAVDMTAVLTNELGTVLLSNQVSQDAFTNLPANRWPGWTNVGQVQSAFMLPWGQGQGFFFLTAVNFSDQQQAFIPLTHTFEQQTNFYLPRWWFTLKTGVRFVLVDTDFHRIVDYVNLEDNGQTVDLTATLVNGADCSGNLATLSDPGAQWCTNRQWGANGTDVPTQGLLNQIAICLALNGQLPPMSSMTLDPYAGLDGETAVDSFRYNLEGWGPVYPKDQGKTFYRSNVFYVPFDPYRPIFIHTSWQANDPLVHYTIGDLMDLIDATNQVNFVSENPPLGNLGQINNRYEPWGGNPVTTKAVLPPFEISAKDPLITRSDNWDFPATDPLSLEWLGRVHRGTPWQTIFLKSKNILQRTGTIPAASFFAWELWTGNGVWDFNLDGGGNWVPDAYLTLPTNDWRLASLLMPLLGTNDLRALPSVNQSQVTAWTGLLNELVAFTNPTPSELDSVIISSNSAQAALLANAINAERALQPGQVFRDAGDIIATPELSVASPWLNSASTAPDAAYEVLPSQLLWLLRSDSTGSINANPSGFQVQFTGYDGLAYSVETSTNLTDWVTVETAFPTNGVFNFQDNPPAIGASRFYRSMLLP